MSTGRRGVPARIAGLVVGVLGLVTVAVAGPPAAVHGPPSNDTRQSQPPPPDADAAALARRILEAVRDGDYVALIDAEQDGVLAREADAWQWKLENRRVGRERARTSTDPAEIAQLRAELEPLADWTMVWNQLRTPEGRESLVSLWQPTWASEAPRLQDWLQAEIGALADAVAGKPGHDAADRNDILAMRDAAIGWLQRTDFSDPQRLRAALAAIGKAIEQSRLESPDAWRDLPFDDAMVLGGLAFTAAKQVAAAYDLDLQGILQSASVHEIAREADVAVIRFAFTAFDVPVALRYCLRWDGDDWNTLPPGEPCPPLANIPASSPGSPTTPGVEPPNDGT